MAKKKLKQEPTGSIIFGFVRAHIARMDWAQLEELAEKSGLTAPALYFWQQGITESPRVANIEKVLVAMGFRIEDDGGTVVTIDEPAYFG